MQPGLYVLAPVGLGHTDGELAASIPLVESVELVSFHSSWKDEVRRFLEDFRKKYSAFSETDTQEFEKTRHCLVLRFADPDGGKPIDREVYDQRELDIGGRARRTYGLTRRWLRSFAVLLIAGRINFGCFRYWFGLKVAEPPEKPWCYHASPVGWYGRVVTSEKREAIGDEYWTRVRTAAHNLAICPDESRLAVATDMFARAVFADDWRVEMLCYWVALEALFGQAETELSHQLCERAAAFCEPPGQGRHTLYRKLKSAYGLRSKLVHGTLHHPTEEGQGGLSAAIDFVEGTVRNALCHILTDGDMTRRFLQEQKHLVEYFEKQVLAPECVSRT